MHSATKHGLRKSCRWLLCRRRPQCGLCTPATRRAEKEKRPSLKNGRSEQEGCGRASVGWRCSGCGCQGGRCSCCSRHHVPRCRSTHICRAHMTSAVQEGHGEHQQPTGAGDEERQVLSGLQDRPQDPALRQGWRASRELVLQCTLRSPCHDTACAVRSQAGYHQ